MSRVSNNSIHQASSRIVLVLALVALTLAAAACQNDNDQQSATTVPTISGSVTPAPDSPTVTPGATSATSAPAATTTPLPPGAPTPTPPPTVTPTTTSLVVAPSPTSTSIPVTPITIPKVTPTPTSTPVIVPAPPEPILPAPPDRDLQDLGRRLVPGYSEPKTDLASEPLTLGQPIDFWVSRDGGALLVSGEVSYISENVYWVFENGYEPDPEDIAEVAAKFESEVWPAVTGVFGPPLTPGIDGDDRMVVYTSVLRTGVAGYFSAADSYPREIRPHSNQREALYMSANRVNLTSSEYLSVIAHELQHATHFATDSSEDSWVNEGLSEIAAEIAGFARSAASAFVRAPSTSLTAWAQDISISAANYGAANLFFAFLASHYGGNDMLAAIAANQEDGIASVDSSLAQQGYDVTADDVFADWLIANYLSTNEGPYGYDEHSVPPVRNIYKRAPDSLSGSVKSYGANYVVTSSGSGVMTVGFQGEPETALLTDAPFSGETCW